MRVTGIDACRRGWVAVTLDDSGTVALSSARLACVRVHGSLASLLAAAPADPVTADPVTADPVTADPVTADPVTADPVTADPVTADPVTVVGIDMPLGLLESGWREADLAARGLLGPRRSSVFAIPPEAVWAEASYQAANRRCRELTGQGFSIQAWGLRAKLLEANQYRETCGHPLYEVHPELAFGAMAGAALPFSKHTAPGRELRRELLAKAGILLPAAPVPAAPLPAAPVTDTLDAAAVAWSAWRIAAGRAIVLPDPPQVDRQGREITIRY
jgi:predicted RNase H-like nuclease